jgi:hypothetical protein
MAKIKNDMLPAMLEKQRTEPKRVKKNSICEVCYCVFCLVKISKNRILCKECYEKERDNGSK